MAFDLAAFKRLVSSARGERNKLTNRISEVQERLKELEDAPLSPDDMLEGMLTALQKEKLEEHFDRQMRKNVQNLASRPFRDFSQLRPEALRLVHGGNLGKVDPQLLLFALFHVIGKEADLRRMLTQSLARISDDLPANPGPPPAEREKEMKKLNGELRKLQDELARIDTEFGSPLL